MSSKGPRETTHSARLRDAAVGRPRLSQIPVLIIAPASDSARGSPGRDCSEISTEEPLPPQLLPRNVKLFASHHHYRRRRRPRYPTHDVPLRRPKTSASHPPPTHPIPTSHLTKNSVHSLPSMAPTTLTKSTSASTSSSSPSCSGPRRR